MYIATVVCPFALGGILIKDLPINPALLINFLASPLSISGVGKKSFAHIVAL